MGRIAATLLAVLVVAATSCGGGDDDARGGGDEAAPTALPECPLDALDEADGPVEITYWHGVQRELEATLQQLTEQFNTSQDRVRVTLVNNADQDQHEKFLAGLTTGDVPDILLHQETYLRQMVDVQAVLPAQSCIDAAGYDMSDFLAPLPGRTEDAGAVVGGAGLYITATDTARQAAAWEFISFLPSPESQSVWSAGTGYVPVRESAIQLPEVQQRWREVPGFRTAYDQLVEGAESEATAGAVVGDIAAVREAVEDALTRMFLDGLPPDQALARAASDADAAIAAYNERVG